MVSSANASVRARGLATQSRILEKAVHIASVEGLASMSLATLAKATSMSKSGLFAHFRSKEALQIAIIDEAERIFIDVVVKPSLAQSGGARLRTLLASYVDYCARGPFEGGCFFCAAAHEFDGRPGPVRDRVATFYDGWHGQLKAALAAAGISIDVDQFVFDVCGLGFGVNFASQLGEGPERARARGADAVQSLLKRVT